VALKNPADAQWRTPADHGYGGARKENKNI
jgi:hypothetical protein